MPHQTLSEEILAEWAELQGELADLDPDSAEAWDRRGRMTQLRDAYEQLILQARAADVAAPPPFPRDVMEDGPDDVVRVSSGARESRDGR